MKEETALRQMKEMEKNSRFMRLAAESWESDFQILIAIIMSARTLDETTISVGTKLFEKYPDAKYLAKADLEDIKKIINRINCFENKARYLVGCSKILVEKYNGKPPHDLDKLIELPGVGRKTANVFLSEVGKNGIGIDTHVQYISKKLGWTSNSNPEKIEDDLKKLFSEKNWNNVNSTLVRFGKTYTSRIKKDEILEKIKEIR